jgi:hypothetical protein
MPGTQYTLVIYAVNSKGRSHTVSLSAVTLSPPEKHIAKGMCFVQKKFFNLSSIQKWTKILSTIRNLDSKFDHKHYFEVLLTCCLNVNFYVSRIVKILFEG